MSREFSEYVVDLLRDWAAVTARRMFGGYGMYRGDLMFGLIASDVLYFKVGDANRPDYEAAGSAPFFVRDGKVALPYWQVPESVMEDGMLDLWAKKAWIVAQQTRKPKKRKKARLSKT